MKKLFYLIVMLSVISCTGANVNTAAGVAGIGDQAETEIDLSDIGLETDSQPIDSTELYRILEDVETHHSRLTPAKSMAFFKRVVVPILKKEGDNQDRHLIYRNLIKRNYNDFLTADTIVIMTGGDEYPYVNETQPGTSADCKNFFFEVLPIGSRYVAVRILHFWGEKPHRTLIAPGYYYLLEKDADGSYLLDNIVYHECYKMSY